jgi:hypothetical protein
MNDLRHDPQHDDGNDPETGRSPSAQPTWPGGSVAGLGYTGAEGEEEEAEPVEDGVEGLGYTGRDPIPDEDEELSRPL